MNKVRPAIGDFVTICVKIIQPVIGSAYEAELSDHTRITIPANSIIGIDRKKPTKDSIVEIILPNRQGLVGVVLCIDNADAFVRWTTEDRPEGRPSVENIETLRVTHVQPA